MTRPGHGDGLPHTGVELAGPSSSCSSTDWHARIIVAVEPARRAGWPALGEGPGPASGEGRDRTPP
jgi:hypothetical protein